MLGWYKHIQEVTTDLRKVARIIGRQNPNSLEWAERRLWEFAEILVRDYSLVPDRVHNGTDWTGSYDENEDDLIFFDHYYGVGQDVYFHEEVSLRLGLQCAEGASPASVVECKLFFGDGDHDYEEGTPYPGHGHISLTGQRGVWWTVDVSLFCRGFVDRFTKDVGSWFSSVLPDDYSSMESGEHHRDRFAVTAKEARELFHNMARYLIEKKK